MNQISLNSVSFDKEFDGKLILESWIDKNSLEEHESWEQIINTGTFENISLKRPRRFKVGTAIDVEEHLLDTDYQFLLTKVAVGKSYVMTESEYEE